MTKSTVDGKLDSNKYNTKQRLAAPVRVQVARHQEEIYSSFVEEVGTMKWDMTRQLVE